jgi:hypothetical protein
MKHALRLSLLALAALAAGCVTVQGMQTLATSEDFKSSGAAKMDNSLSTLALGINGNFEPDGSADAPTGQALAEIRKFGDTLARRLPAEFPEQLKPYGVGISPPGRGVPLLRLYLASGRGQCDGQRGTCQAEARIDGSLIGSDGRRAWWFTYWIDVDDPDQNTYRNIYKRIVEGMAKDQVVTPDQ